MGIRVLEASADCPDAPGQAVMFDSVTGHAFGPLFESGDDARDFLRWVELEALDDPRTLGMLRLHDALAAWRRSRIRGLRGVA